MKATRLWAILSRKSATGRSRKTVSASVSISKGSVRYSLTRSVRLWKEVQTPLATASVQTSDTKIVAATILRAGLPIHKGIVDIFDNAESAFIAAYRKYDKVDEFHRAIEYCTCPSLSGKALILADTMIATGASMEIAYNKLVDEGGEPTHTHFISPVSSVYAIEYLQKRFPENTTLWTAAIDEELTSQSYIIPGIGDAGDLAFGEKVNL